MTESYLLNLHCKLLKQNLSLCRIQLHLYRLVVQLVVAELNGACLTNIKDKLASCNQSETRHNNRVNRIGMRIILPRRAFDGATWPCA